MRKAVSKDLLTSIFDNFIVIYVIFELLGGSWAFLGGSWALLGALGRSLAAFLHQNLVKPEVLRHVYAKTLFFYDVFSFIRDLGASWGSLGVFLGLPAALGCSWAGLGARERPRDAPMEALGRLLGALGRLLGALGALLAGSWAALGRSWAALGRSWVDLVCFWGSLLAPFQASFGKTRTSRKHNKK